MEVIDDFTAKSIAEPIKKWISKHSKSFIYKFKPYQPIKDQFPITFMKVSPGKIGGN